MSPSFQRLATLTVSTKRSVINVGTGRKGLPSIMLEDIRALPLFAVDPETRLRLGLDSPYILLQTFMEYYPDVIVGDVLVTDEGEYPIRSIQQVPWKGAYRLGLIVEDQKQKV